jgi:hypothetical protein
MDRYLKTRWKSASRRAPEVLRQGTYHSKLYRKNPFLAILVVEAVESRDISEGVKKEALARRSMDGVDDLT